MVTQDSLRDENGTTRGTRDALRRDVYRGPKEVATHALHPDMSGCYLVIDLSPA